MIERIKNDWERYALVGVTAYALYADGRIVATAAVILGGALILQLAPRRPR